MGQAYCPQYQTDNNSGVYQVLTLETLNEKMKAVPNPGYQDSNDGAGRLACVCPWAVSIMVGSNF